MRSCKKSAFAMDCPRIEPMSGIEWPYQWTTHSDSTEEAMLRNTQKTNHTVLSSTPRQMASNSSPPLDFHEVFPLWPASALRLRVLSTSPMGAPTPPKGKKALRKPPEKSKFVCHAIKFPNPQQPTREGTLATGLPIIQEADSEEDDLM
ncbi:hypothetical protein E2320_002127, partial [Naja naja]